MPPAPLRNRRSVVAACVVALCFAAAVIMGVSGNRSPESSQPLQSGAVEAGSVTVEDGADRAVSDSLASDENLRRLIVGLWEDDYQGHRTLVLREDGTGTMIVELSGLPAKLFASRLEFQMRWSVSGGRFQERCVGGKPAAQVDMILKTVGDRVDQPILELTGDRLLLLDKDGKTRYDWRRVR